MARRVSARDFVWLFLGFRGRIGRQAYFLAGLLLLVALMFAFDRFLAAPEGSSESGFWASTFMIAATLSIISNIALAAKRLQDIDRPPLLAGLYLLGGFFMWLFLCFVPGTPGPNKYGPGPDQPV